MPNHKIWCPECGEASYPTVGAYGKCIECGTDLTRMPLSRRVLNRVVTPYTIAAAVGVLLGLLFVVMFG